MAANLARAEYAVYRYERIRVPTQTIFSLTARLPTRPDHSVQSICLRVDQRRTTTSRSAGQDLMVLFADPNGRKSRAKNSLATIRFIRRQFHRAARPGHGRDAHLCDTGPNGQANFNVEEYKLPKFQVTARCTQARRKVECRLLPCRPRDELHRRGGGRRAVKYRVVREVRWPSWWGWYSGAITGPKQQEIAHAPQPPEPMFVQNRFAART